MKRKARKIRKTRIVYRLTSDIPEDERQRRLDRAFSVLFIETLKRWRNSELKGGNKE